MNILNVMKSIRQRMSNTINNLENNKFQKCYIYYIICNYLLYFRFVISEE